MKTKTIYKQQQQNKAKNAHSKKPINKTRMIEDTHKKGNNNNGK